MSGHEFYNSRTIFFSLELSRIFGYGIFHYSLAAFVLRCSGMNVLPPVLDFLAAFVLRCTGMNVLPPVLDILAAFGLRSTGMNVLPPVLCFLA
jgi:hypothetical protein